MKHVGFRGLPRDIITLSKIIGSYYIWQVRFSTGINRFDLKGFSGVMLI